MLFVQELSVGAEAAHDDVEVVGHAFLVGAPGNPEPVVELKQRGVQVVSRACAYLQVLQVAAVAFKPRKVDVKLSVFRGLVIANPQTLAGEEGRGVKLSVRTVGRNVDLI